MSGNNQKQQGPSYREIAQRIRAEAERFATQVIGEPPSYRSAGEVRYLENNSLRVFISGRKQGRYMNFVDESDRGDMLDLYRSRSGADKHAAIEFAKDFLGIDRSNPEASLPKIEKKSEEELARQEAQANAKRLRDANWIWDTSSPTEGREEAVAYLNGRGISKIPGPNVLRFRKLSAANLKKMSVPEADIPANGAVALVFAATNDAGQVRAVQQILTSNGKKLDTKIKKITNGLLNGSYVRLGDPADASRILYAEGPETAMSIYQATGLPTRIVLGSTNYANITPEPDKEHVIGADMDESGVGLANALRGIHSWNRVGAERGGIALPRLQEGDFNDVHQQQGEEAVKHSIDGAFFADRVRHDDALLLTHDSRVAFHAWMRTGIETTVRRGQIDKETGKRRPIMVEGSIEPRHRAVMIIEDKAAGFEFSAEHLEKSRDDVTLYRPDISASEVIARSRDKGFIQRLVQRVDLYTPSGLGEKDPLIMCLRRKDADAFASDGRNALSVRPTEVSNIDFTFLSGRRAVIAAVGTGHEADKTLESRLGDAGVETSRYMWQLFRPRGEGKLEMVREKIPSNYSGAEAIAEGWKGRALEDLLAISEMNREQQMRAQGMRNVMRERVAEER